MLRTAGADPSGDACVWLMVQRLAPEKATMVLLDALATMRAQVTSALHHPIPPLHLPISPNICLHLPISPMTLATMRAQGEGRPLEVDGRPLYLVIAGNPST